ncbi:MAG: 16S rRNA (cytidine(1402)-2'-O)-methyltransferase [Parcubacteria group bacterium]|nr:16S rRNA (cytidine(1402)-2'-O)-methyltransferase [Parcubacteria group bacterium]
MFGKIFVVATPIGNLKDITLRGLEVLKEADFILAEDTRVAKKLLSHYQISKPVISFFEHSPLAKARNLVKLLREGKSLALLSDAGTPNLSDPGCGLIKQALDEFGEGLKIEVLPGPSALTALISIAHFPLNEFVFLGFPPAKKGRQKFFKSVADESRPVIIFESTHRLLKTLKGLSDVVPNREMVLAKELTKKFERVWRGDVDKVYMELQSLSATELKGEFAMILR